MIASWAVWANSGWTSPVSFQYSVSPHSASASSLVRCALAARVSMTVRLPVSDWRRATAWAPSLEPTWFPLSVAGCGGKEGGMPTPFGMILFWVVFPEGLVEGELQLFRGGYRG